MFYSTIIPPIKAIFNEDYLHDIVNDITEGKTTDHEKINAILEWFDPDFNNLYNSWTLTHSVNPFYILLDQYMIFTNSPPYICVRCYDSVDAK